MHLSYSMEANIRKHDGLRTQVRDGLGVLLTQARQIWGPKKTRGKQRITGAALGPIVNRLMVGVGDLARLARDNPDLGQGLYNDAIVGGDDDGPYFYLGDLDDKAFHELKKELGNILFSTIRWIDDLGLDPLGCLELAIEAQEKFANSGRPR